MKIMSMLEKQEQFSKQKLEIIVFFVIFDNHSDSKWYKDCIIKIEDLQFVEDGNVKDEEILEALPKQNPKWWCKVEDGYIINLLGEKKNKIPYDYKS